MHYQFKNVNPLGAKELDCVTRAITGALDLNYYEVKNKLELVGALFECEKLCVCCYKFLLDEVYGLDRIEEYSGLTIDEFSGFCPSGKFLIRVDNHLTYLENSVVYDIWDCRDEIVRIVWVVE